MRRSFFDRSALILLVVFLNSAAFAVGARKEPMTLVCTEISNRTPTKCLDKKTAILSEENQIGAWTQFQFESSVRPVQHVWYFGGQEVSRRTLTPTYLGWRGVTTVSTKGREGEWRLDVVEADGMLIRSYLFILERGRAGRVGRLLSSDARSTVQASAQSSQVPTSPAAELLSQTQSALKAVPAASPQSERSPETTSRAADDKRLDGQWLSFQAGTNIVWQSGSWNMSGLLYYNPRFFLGRFELGIAVGYSYLKRDDTTYFSQFEYLGSAAYQVTEKFSVGVRSGAQAWTCANCATSVVVGPHLEYAFNRGWVSGVWSSYLLSFRDPSSSAAALGLRFEVPH